MTVKTVGSVIEDINEWENPRGGSVFYVTCIFTDETVGSVGRKDHDAALEVQGLLRESIGTELDFTLEPKGQTKTGRDKFKILGFGTPGGAATYTAPGVQGGGGSAPAVQAPSAPARATRPPEHDHYIQERMDRRTALMQAVIVTDGTRYWGNKDLFEVAGDMYKWLQSSLPTYIYNVEEVPAKLSKTSEPAPSAYEADNPVEGTPADVGSEDSAGGVSSSLPDPADSAGEAGEGEASVSTPHHPMEVAAPHEHDWQMRQGVRSHLVCDCGATRKRETATK